MNHVITICLFSEYSEKEIYFRPDIMIGNWAKYPCKYEPLTLTIQNNRK